MRTFPSPITAIASDVQQHLVVSEATEEGPALAKLDAEGRTLWERPSFDALASVSGLSVAPSGVISAWGGLGWKTGPGSWNAFRFDAEGNDYAVVGTVGDDQALGPALEDARGNRVRLETSPYGSSITYTAPGGGGWHLDETSLLNPSGYTRNTSYPSFLFNGVAFGPAGDVFVSVFIDGEGEWLGTRLGKAGQKHFVVIRMSPEKEVRWARELPLTRGSWLWPEAIPGLSVATDGSVFALVPVSEARLREDVFTDSVKPAQATLDLLALTRDGEVRWAKRLSLPAPAVARLAVSQNGRIAVSATHSDSSAPASCQASAHILTFARDGSEERAFKLAPRMCTGNVGVYGITFRGDRLVVAGVYRGTVELTRERTVSSANGEGFVFELSR
ncbi:MAG TPA: hypothetical protein VE153_25065 [Myxococcus sp.]|nr:hypothetical protein [Myxococcus sp.]